MPPDPDRISFVMLGHSRWGSYYHREQALAAEIARRGYRVSLVEEMPSLAASVRRWTRRAFSQGAVEEEKQPPPVPEGLTVHRPPVVPTTYRSSYTPAIDQLLFRRWFAKTFSGQQWEKTVLIVTFPYLWTGFVNKAVAPARFVQYDLYDSVEMPSRTKRAYERMRQGERLLKQDISLVTYSAHAMQEGVQENFGTIPHVCIPNAVSSEFLGLLDHIPPHARTGRKTIGYIGGMDARWTDRELLCSAIRAYPECDFVIRGSVENRFARVLKSYPNVRLVGFTGYAELAGIVRRFDLGLIPFKANAIAHVINPLKMYEYAAAGIPVLASRTRELEHYADIAALADDRDDFVKKIGILLREDDRGKRIDRRTWAEKNTWNHRVDEYFDFLQRFV